MQALAKIGHNRFPPFTTPERDISKQVIVKPWRSLLDCLREIPAHYLWEQMKNPPCECCRDPENLELEIRKTQDLPEIAAPDLYVMRCGCGREHIRMLGDTGNYSTK